MPRSRGRVSSWLGYGGLIAFLALAGLTYADRERAMIWHGDLCTYGALILSFVGALHWGSAMVLRNISQSQGNAMYAWSVTPCLIAWVSLSADSAPGDGVLVSGFLAHHWRDRRVRASRRVACVVSCASSAADRRCSHVHCGHGFLFGVGFRHWRSQSTMISKDLEGRLFIIWAIPSFSSGC